MRLDVGDGSGAVPSKPVPNRFPPLPIKEPSPPPIPKYGDDDNDDWLPKNRRVAIVVVDGMENERPPMPRL